LTKQLTDQFPLKWCLIEGTLPNKDRLSPKSCEAIRRGIDVLDGLLKNTHDLTPSTDLEVLGNSLEAKAVAGDLADVPLHAGALDGDQEEEDIMPTSSRHGLSMP
jgi:hypothetical protein